MPWPLPEQRVLVVLAALLLLLTVLSMEHADTDVATFVSVVNDPRLDLRIDLNRATPADLEALPGIGPSLAGAIVAHRVRSGPFRVVGDLEAVPRIGRTTARKLETYLVVQE